MSLLSMLEDAEQVFGDLHSGQWGCLREYE